MALEVTRNQACVLVGGVGTLTAWGSLHSCQMLSEKLPTEVRVALASVGFLTGMGVLVMNSITEKRTVECKTGEEYFEKFGEVVEDCFLTLQEAWSSISVLLPGKTKAKSE